MRNWQKSVLFLTLLTLLGQADILSAANQGKKPTLRLEGETREQMIDRLFERELQLDPHQRRMQAHQKNQALAQSLQQIEDSESSEPYIQKRCKKAKDYLTCFDKHFVGYWILDSIDDWSNATLIQFYRNGEDTRCKFFDGPQTHLREQTNDRQGQVQVSPAGSDIPVEMLSSTSLRFFNNALNLSSDDRRSTMKIQDSDSNLAYCQFWTDWDGSADDPRYGIIENMTAYRRLPERPDIQLNYLPSATDWTNPVNQLNYIAEYLNLLGQVEKAQVLNQQDYIGWDNAQAYLQQMLTTGVTHSAHVSTVYRGDGYIGVWRTQFPNDLPVTTIHTDGPHRFNYASQLYITGFKGAYEPLNGTHLVAPVPRPSILTGSPYPWQQPESNQHMFYLQFDSSNITEAYDPNIHGVALIEAKHGPVTPTIEYRESIAAMFDYIATVFGSSTHMRPQVWLRPDRLTLPETWQELKEGLAAGTITRLLTLSTNARNFHGNHSFYWNPAIFGGSTASTQFNINDPYGLWASFVDPTYDLDIVIDNYLDPSKVYNTFFTVTGPELECQPITSLLTSFGYTSNGSQVVFTANPFQTPPPPLVDAYGVHPWSYYGVADNFAPDELRLSHYLLVGGIVQSNLTPGQTVAYIRVGSEDAFDAPLYQLSTRSLAFGRSDMASKMNSNWTAAMAALLEKLNQFQPNRYIIDIRQNGGGFGNVPAAFAALFGGNRPGVYNSMAYPGNGQRDPTLFLGSGFQSAYDSIEINATKEALIDADEAAAVFPNGVVRSAENRIDLIILDSVNAGSAGDMFPHFFIGPDPLAVEHDLGNNVICRIIGELDGRLFSGFKGNDGLAVDPLNHNLHSPTGMLRSAFYPSTDAGVVVYDRHGSMCNYQP